MPAPVLQVISSNARRGAEVFALDLAAAIEERGRSVETVALVASPLPDPLPVPVLGDRSLGPSTLRALRRRIDSASMVVSYASRSLPACAAATLGTGKGFVYRSIGDVVSYAATPLRRARVTFYLRRATAVVALWPGGADALTHRHGVPKDKIRVIPRGVPAERFPSVDASRRADARRRFGLDPGAPVALCLGALIQDKNPDAAVDAVATVPGLHLVVAGDGPERERVEAYARERLPGRAHFLGVQDDPAAVLAASDVLVLPSLTEGMPGVAIEAGLTGLPVVATDVGAVREVVVDGETGVVVPLGDPIALANGVAQALAEADVMGPRARERCLGRFEIGIVSQAWLELLDALDPDGRAP